MELYLDTADVNEIRELNETLSIDGVTTNPTILSRAGRDYAEVLKEILAVLNEKQKLFVQVVSEDVEGMIEEGRKIGALGKNVCIKIPVSESGLKAIRQLHEEGYTILATAIFTDVQGYLAAKNGADYLAPYVNRMNSYGNGLEETVSMEKMLRAYGSETKILAASFHYLDQVKYLMQNGIDAVTVPAAIAREMYRHPGTDKSVAKFNSDFFEAFGKKKVEL